MRWNDSFACVMLKVSFGWLAGERFQHTHSPNSSAGKLCIREPASGETVSDCALLWETTECFLHINEMEICVYDPNTHSKPPDADLESRESLANEASWNKSMQAIFNVASQMAKLSLVLWLDRCKRSILATFGHIFLLDFWQWSNQSNYRWSTGFCRFFYMGSCSATFRSLWYHPHKPIKKNPCFLCIERHSRWYCFPSLSQFNYFKNLRTQRSP